MHTKTTTMLDISIEKKILIRQITIKKQIYAQLIHRKNFLAEQISQFESLYHKKIKKLQDKLYELDRILFKYRNISEYVDDLLSFSEAQQIFEDAMHEKEARTQEENRKEKKKLLTKDKKAHLSLEEKKELKKLYRELARAFHPDKTGGSDHIMMLINQAYQNGNIQALRNLDLEYINKPEDNTFGGLVQTLTYLNRLIDKTTADIHALKKSDMYTLRNKLLKENNTPNTHILDLLANKFKTDIQKKEREVEDFKKKFNVHKEESL